MVIAALVSFGILLVAWIAAPDRPKSIEMAEAQPAPAEPRAMAA